MIETVSHSIGQTYSEADEQAEAARLARRLVRQLRTGWGKELKHRKVFDIHWERNRWQAMVTAQIPMVMPADMNPFGNVVAQQTSFNKMFLFKRAPTPSDRRPPWKCLRHEQYNKERHRVRFGSERIDDIWVSTKREGDLMIIKASVPGRKEHGSQHTDHALIAALSFVPIGVKEVDGRTHATAWIDVEDMAATAA